MQSGHAAERRPKVLQNPAVRKSKYRSTFSRRPREAHSNLSVPIDPELPRVRAEPLADEFWNWINAEFPSAKNLLPITDFWPIYVNAILAYDAGAYEAAVVMCRTAVESIGYTYMTHRPAEGNAWAIYPPRGGKFDVKFPAIRDYLLTRVPLTDNQKASLTRIKDEGDIAAHIAERAHKRLHAFVNPEPGVHTAHEALNVWTDEERARQIVVDTLDLAKAVLLAAKRDRPPDDGA